MATKSKKKPKKANKKGTSLVGARIKRKEDPRLIQGLAHYVDDIRLPDTLHLAFLRSPYGHAKILSINTDAARRSPGVVDVLTGEDMKGKIGGVPSAGELPGLKVPAHPCLAIGRVRYVGEPVALVVAEDRYQASDAVDRIEADYDPLPAVVDPEKAIAKGAKPIHEKFKDNVAFRTESKEGNWKKLEKSRKSLVVIKQRIVNQRLAPVAIEPRGVLADYKPGEDQLSIWTSTQIPHLAKTQISVMLGMDETRVRLVAPEVGGGFGSKLNVYAEEGLVGFMARKLCRPVKWIESRRENMQATIHGRDLICDVEVFAQKDGKLVGLKCDVVADLGAYFQLLTPLIPTLTGLMILGCYNIRTLEFNLTGVFTNKMATDAYRGAGRPEATYIIERVVDMVAHKLGKDPADVRRKNFPKPKDFPLTLVTGVTYDSANYQASFKKVLDHVGYPKLRKKQEQLRKKGRYIGIGLSTYVEICAMGPSSRMAAGGWESGTVRVEPTGKITVMTGVSPTGQGQETVFAQIVAQEMGVGMDDVTVVHGDTGAVQYGIGTFGSRGTALGGTAILLAMEKVKAKMAKIAAHKLKVSAKDLIFENYKIRSKRSAKKSIGLLDVIGEAYYAKQLPPGVDPGLEASHVFEPSNFTFPFGAHVAEVEVDPETGQVELTGYTAVDDCGRVINPMLVEGQVHGGIAQSVGQVLWEEHVYDENGQLITGELMDYAIPRATGFPMFKLDRTVTPTPVNPLGVKGVGEAGTIGSTPAVVNAVVDALKPLGVTHVDMPLKPEKIWRLIQERRAL